MDQQIMVVGLGLMGASLALCIKQANPKAHLIGWDTFTATKQEALRKRIVDEIPKSFADGAIKADRIILAVPVETTKGYLLTLEALPLKSQVLVTDTSSTKKQIVDLAETLSFDFIGGHPMAGSHKSGLQAADVDLFENAFFIFTPTDPARLTELHTLFRGTRARYLTLAASEHDQITGMLSHLPHIIASGLVQQANEFSQIYSHAKQLAAGGFRDITRIASSDPAMWTDILLTNKEVLLSLLQQWQTQMTQVTDWLIQEDAQQIFSFFKEAKETRDQLPVHTNGAIPAFYDLFVDVPDRPGVVAEVTGLLSESSLSLINLKILETREDIIGVLQITFKTQRDLVQATQLISEKTTYRCRVK